MNFFALGVGEERGGGFFDEFLEAALQGAVAGAGDDDVAVLVGNHLGFDVARLVEVALDEAFPTPERGDRFAGGRIEQFGDFLAGAGDFHAASAATERGFDRDREAVFVDEREDFVGILDRLGSTGDRRCFGAGGDVAGGDLVAEVADRLRGRADPDQSGVHDGLGEVGVLGEKSVAGVDGVGTGLGGGVEDLVDHQIRLRRGLSTQCEGFVGQPDERGIGIGLGVHSDTGQPGIGGRPDHPHRDLTTIGDKNLRDFLMGSRGSHVLKFLHWPYRALTKRAGALASPYRCRSSGRPHRSDTTGASTVAEDRAAVRTATTAAMSASVGLPRNDQPGDAAT